MAEGRSPFARPDDVDDVPHDDRGTPDDHAATAPRPRRAAPDDLPEREPAPAESPGPAPAHRAAIVDDDPAPARPTRPARRPRGSSPGLVIGGVVGLVVLVTVGAFAVRQLTAAPTPVEPGPDQVAADFLRAVAAGDAERAQSLSAIRIDSPTFSRPALEAARAAAPLTDVTVESVNGQDVVLAYRRGGQAVRGTFPMVHVAEGWRVRRPTVRTRIAPQPQMVTPLLDGQKLEARGYTYDVELAPGVHTLSLPGGFLRFEQPQVVVSGLTDAPQVNARTRPTDAYPAELKKRLSERIQGCVRAKELAPKGCPWAFRAAPGETVDPGSIAYTMGSDPFASFTAPAPGTADAIVRGELRFPLKVTARAKTAGGGNATISDEKLVIATYEADLADADLPFVWA